MNRAQRRKMRSQAQHTATVLAGCCFDYDATGNLVPVEHPRAVALLKRTFTVMLQNNCEPHVIQISQADARTFPRGNSDKVPDDCPSWRGVAIDVVGRGAYTLRHSKVLGAPVSIQKQIANKETKAHLTVHTSKPGFPTSHGA
ncbi:hypothetical protein [uncultured Shimia sp.]|uniref:hypothetical protein n=1 Tax=uncultured Shimia sp. TaxID=573152 RepID=UPI0026337D14|nr:hypothetical protein [uncultured Shimia sp.]